ncbi:TonB family protein [Pseudomaricurvus sp. HS19]|uniref:TonB family protein n=1 Tax=Pseudomaricurvus sp. HS19 TaxID=2692626 RepID=UPI0013719FED|nr:TonB family protein [Pseudomaricurvus sp. HS19]MYM62076.1 TonB family protein [Pseudomaricurvus sp. HS19]
MSLRYKAMPLWEGFLCLLLVVSGQAFAAETGQQLGAARYQQFNKPVLIASLYGPSSPKADAAQMIEGKQPFRLLVALETDSMSPRQFRRLWIEGAAVNLSASQLANATNDLSVFTSSFKGRLQRGDRIVIDYDPAAGTEVSFNGTTIAGKAGANLGPVLLRGWIGQVPLSTEFKTSLLESGISDTDLLLTMESLPRRTSVAAVASEPEPAEVSEPAAPVAEIAAATAPAVAKPAAKPAAAPVKAIPAPVAKAKPAVVAAKPTPAPVVTKPEPAPKAAPAQVAVAKPKPAPKPAPAPVAEEVEEEDMIQTAEQLAAEQQFYQKLVREVRHYQTVPFQAFQRQWQDDVRLQVTIDRQGNLQGIEILKPSRYDLFNKQARSAVEKASPFSKIPAELGMKTYTFSVLLDYRLMR